MADPDRDDLSDSESEEKPDSDRSDETAEDLSAESDESGTTDATDDGGERGGDDIGDEEDATDDARESDERDAADETVAGDGTDESDERDAADETVAGDGTDESDESDAADETVAEDGADESDESDAADETVAGEDADKTSEGEDVDDLTDIDSAEETDDEPDAVSSDVVVMGEEDEDAAEETKSGPPKLRKRRHRPPRESPESETDTDDEETDGQPIESDDGTTAADDDANDNAVSNGAGATSRRQLDDEPLFEGPESDEEMPLADHIEEMMRRLGIVFLVAGIATLIAYPSADAAINYFWSSHIPDPAINRPRVYGPLEFILTKLKVAGIAGVIFGLPVFVYETYLFMKPGLYQNERRYYVASIPTSLVLAAIGSLFAHFIVLPAIFAYFTAYTEGTAVIAFGLRETFNLIVILIAYMAVVFQIPLLIMLAIMMNITSRQWLEDKRLLFWGGFLGLSWLVTPDPTGMAPIIVTLTMIGLYEGTLALLRWTGN